MAFCKKVEIIGWIWGRKDECLFREALIHSASAGGERLFPSRKHHFFDPLIYFPAIISEEKIKWPGSRCCRAFGNYRSALAMASW